MVPNGQMAVKALMCRWYGTNLPRGPTPPNTIMAVIMKMHQMKVTLNFFKMRGTSSKNDVSLASFAVAPQDMSMLNMCERSAWET